MTLVKLYGADWCHDTHAVRNNPSSASEWVKQQNDGKAKRPTLDISGTVLSVPDERDLEKFLRGTGLMS